MSDEQRLHGMDRRGFLRAAAVGFPLAALLPEGRAQAQTPVATGQEIRRLPGMIIREKMPENLEFPFSTLDTFLTPNDRFYVRSHFAVPTLDATTWRLRVEGAVKTPLELTLADLMQMPSRTTPATLECAGNGRVFLSPAAKGAQWELGAVSNAEWTGVSLGAVLQRAGVLPGAVEVVLEGADSGEIKDPPKPSGPIHFARSLPLAQADRPDVLLAYHMNGAELPAAHGFPLRGVVPGWYGVASVKWLTRLIVTDHPFNGHFQSVDYAIWERNNGLPTRVPITEMQVKSQIARPDMREAVATGSVYRIYGAAWTGDSEIVKVEVSADGGMSWQPTKLLGKPTRFTWRFWEMKWNVPTAPGRYTLLSRATDGRGRIQPLQRQPDAENYLIHHSLPIDVDVR
ncbi:MAG: yedY [Chthonomonadaceae bacterium]|nr:yedY [Chthonomonadaceae bacterium]